MLHLDDPLDAIAVHCWNGAWGLLALGFFSAKDLINGAYGGVPCGVYINIESSQRLPLLHSSFSIGKVRQK